MKIDRIKDRGIQFTYTTIDGWPLNMYLIRGERRDFIIDTGLGAPHVAEMAAHLQPDKPAVIVNTHYHWDHVWGNGALPDALIVSHALCREMIASEWDDMMQENDRYCLGDVEMTLPDLVFQKELYFPEDRVRLLYTPGHTIDSISVLDERDGVLHIGDNIGDAGGDVLPGLYCDKHYYMDTLGIYGELDFDTCVSGHNIPLGREVFEKIRELLG